MWWSNTFKPEGKVALIIGGSQGVGADLALKLYERKCSVIIVARTESKLKKTVEWIKKQHPKGPECDYIAADVSQYDKCVELWNELSERGEDPDYIFCCAGSSVPKLFGDLTGKDISDGIDINYKATINIVHTGFKHALNENKSSSYNQHKARHIVLFSSVLAFYPFIGYGQYAPLKAAISSLSQLLQQELRPYNYRVSCVFPGNFLSEGYTEEQKTKPEITQKIEGPSAPITSEKCAEMVLSQLNRGYDTVFTDFIGWLLSGLTLGVLPRSWAFFQVIFSLIFLIFGPLVNWFIHRDIVGFYEDRETKRNGEIEQEVEEEDEQFHTVIEDTK